MAVENWFSRFVDSCCLEGDGAEAVFNMNTLFLLAEKNHLPEEKIATWKKTYTTKDPAPNLGLIKMQINNMLRSRATKRHGLNDPAGDFEAVPVGDSFIEGKIKSENPDGTKIAKTKPKKEASATALQE